MLQIKGTVFGCRSISITDLIHVFPNILCLSVTPAFRIGSHRQIFVICLHTLWRVRYVNFTKVLECKCWLIIGLFIRNWLAVVQPLADWLIVFTWSLIGCKCDHWCYRGFSQRYLVGAILKALGLDQYWLTSHQNPSKLYIVNLTKILQNYSNSKFQVWKTQNHN